MLSKCLERLINHKVRVFDMTSQSGIRILRNNKHTIKTKYGRWYWNDFAEMECNAHYLREIIHIRLGFDDFEFKRLSHFSFDAMKERERFRVPKALEEVILVDKSNSCVEKVEV